MTNIVVAPFYVPSPPQEPVWQGAPVRSGLPVLLSTKVGAVIRRHEWDDGAPWQIPPVKSPILAYLTKQTFYGQGGQAPAKQWRYDWDEAATSLPYPAIMPIPMRPIVVTFYGAQGQVPAKTWRYDWDEAAVWKPWPVDSQIISYLTKQTFFGQGGQVPAKTWRYDWDEAATSIPYPANSPIIRYLTKQTFYGQGGQVPAKQWRYDWDEAAPYQIAPRLLPQTITMLVAFSVPGLPARWNNHYDDFPSWDKRTPQHPLVRVSYIGFNFRWWNNNNDEASTTIWAKQPYNNMVIRAAKAPTSLYNGVQLVTFATVNDDSSFWVGAPFNAPTMYRIPDYFRPQYRLFVSHYIKNTVLLGNTIVTEGKEIPFNWIPTANCEPLNAVAVIAFWNHGPIDISAQNYNVDFYKDVTLTYFAPKAPQCYWQQVPGTNTYVLTGIGAYLGPKAP
jgi:hypothetical protein